MDLLEHPPSVAEEEISSPANGANADSTEPVNTWHEIFKSSSMNQHHGFVATIEQAIMLMKKYELETTTKFSCYKSDKMFGSGDPFSKPRKIFFKGNRIPFDRVPFMIIGTKIFDCQHGPDRKKTEKVKFCKQKEGDHEFKGRRFLPQDTIKFGCPAKILMSEVIRFPGYKITDETERLKRAMSERLRTDVKNGQRPHFERRIYISLPMEKDHKDHVIGEVGGMLQPIDKSLIEKIHTLVGDGVKTVDEMKRHLRHYVKNDLFAGQNPPPITNRRYHPKDLDIRNHMYKASVKQMLSKVDQENLEEKIKGWKLEDPEDQFFFRPCSISPTEGVSEHCLNTDGNVEAHIIQNLLFAHQTDWQRHLIRRYGNEIMLLDATYKTMRYELPLFFLVVKTNVNYTVVGSFITQNETTASIAEALHIFREWNPQWKPQYFMTDFCHEEINAIESTFEGTTTYICDFHREQCWERWLRKTDNGLNNQREEVLRLLRNVAKSPTEDAYEDNLRSLQTTEVWLSNPQLCNWFEKTWLIEAKRWVWAYRQKRFLVSVNTNNGIERQNESFKYQYLKDRNKNSLSGMITILVAEFLPERYQRYVELNTKYSGKYKGYNKTIPKFLQDKPRQFLVHCLNRISSAEEIKPEYIKAGENKGEFHVRSPEYEETWYNLSFGGNDTMPKCNCRDFRHTGLLCKHFFAVFKHNEDWQWDALPESYRYNPHLCLDNAVIFGSTSHLNPVIEDPTDSPLPTFVPQPQMQPKMTTESEITREAMKCRETLKQITSLTYNVEDLNALKELGSSLQSLHDKLLCYQATDENTMPSVKKQQKKEKKDEENHTKKYLPLPVRRKRNAFANRVGQHASIMRNQYFVNVPVNGTTYVKKKKSKKLQKPKQSGTQRQPLLPHFTNPQPPNKKRKLSLTEDEVPPTYHFKKTKYESTTNMQASHPPTKTTTNQQPQTNQANKHQPSQPMTTNQQPPTPTGQFNRQPTSNIQPSQESIKPGTSNQPSQQPQTNQAKLYRPAQPMTTNQQPQTPTGQSNKQPTSKIPPSQESIKPATSHQPSQQPQTNQAKIYRPTQPVTTNQQPQTPTGQSNKQPGNPKNKQQTANKQATKQTTATHAKNQTTSNRGNNSPAVITIDDISPDPKSWFQIQDHDNSTFTLYQDAKNHILRKTTWLCDSEIHAGQILLKSKFPCLDGLHDPAITGELVTPEISEFVQIINTGNHWVCLSTISCRPGTIKIYDSMFQRVSQTAILHSCRMLMHAGDSILFINEKVQKQINSSDCGLFALAFATDLCHGVDPQTQAYDQENMRAHYVSCLESQEMVPFPKTSRRVPYHVTKNMTTVAIFCVCRMPNDKKEYVQCSQCNGWYHPTCVGIPDWVINSRRRWKCDTCRGKNARRSHLH